MCVYFFILRCITFFNLGAMENWGLITYRTTAILFDPKASDAKFKQRIAYTVSWVSSSGNTFFLVKFYCKL